MQTEVQRECFSMRKMPQRELVKALFSHGGPPQLENCSTQEEKMWIQWKSIIQPRWPHWMCREKKMLTLNASGTLHIKCMWLQENTHHKTFLLTLQWAQLNIQSFQLRLSNVQITARNAFRAKSTNLELLSSLCILSYIRFRALEVQKKRRRW